MRKQSWMQLMGNWINNRRLYETFLSDRQSFQAGGPWVWRKNLRQNFYGEGQPACIRGDIPDRIRFRQTQECIITLGGDGTLIQASRDLISLELPMMGINMGHLGYLTQVSGEESMDPVLGCAFK